MSRIEPPPPASRCHSLTGLIMTWSPMSMPSPPAVFMKIVASASVKNQTRFLPLSGSLGISVIARLILRRVTLVLTPWRELAHAPGATLVCFPKKLRAGQSLRDQGGGKRRAIPRAVSHTCSIRAVRDGEETLLVLG